MTKLLKVLLFVLVVACVLLFGLAWLGKKSSRGTVGGDEHDGYGGGYGDDGYGYGGGYDDDDDYGDYDGGYGDDFHGDDFHGGGRRPGSGCPTWGSSTSSTSGRRRARSGSSSGSPRGATGPKPTPP